MEVFPNTLFLQAYNFGRDLDRVYSLRRCGGVCMRAPMCAGTLKSLHLKTRAALKL